MSNNHQNKDKDKCPYCQALVIFDEIYTRHKLTSGQPKVKVAVLRCPKCKKIARSYVPSINSVHEL